jgi:peptide deformylase
MLRGCAIHTFPVDISQNISILRQTEAPLLRDLDKINNDNEERLRIKTIVNDMDFLRKKSEPVAEINQELINTMKEMLRQMYDSNGIGLAGVQVGILKRILVIDLRENDEKNPIFVINPEIVEHSEKTVNSDEGCLSAPEERDTVKRYETVKVKYMDENAREVVLDASGLLAICLQHEIDHLNGIMFIDHLSKLKRDFLVKKVLKNYKNNR